MMNEVFNYRIKITELNTLLQQVMNGLYAYGINAGIRDELKHLPNIFNGEQIPIDIALLSALKDPLVKPLIDLIYALDRHRSTIMQTNGLTEREMLDAFHRGVGARYWPVFIMFTADEFIGLPLSMLEYLEEAVVTLFCLAIQLSESKLNLSAEEMGWMQSPSPKVLAALKKTDRNVCSIIEIVKDVKAGMQKIYEIADSVYGK
jgi:hypothetical protein